MNLNCPNCGTDDTRKLSLVMAEGNVQKGVRLGAAYMYNVWLPFMSAGVGLLFLILLSFFSMAAGVLAFIVCLAIGYLIRRWAKNKFRPAYANLSKDLKQNGYRCSRCEHIFVPAAQ